MDRIHRFMFKMFAWYPYPDNIVCTVGYIVLISLFKRED